MTVTMLIGIVVLTMTVIVAFVLYVVREVVAEIATAEIRAWLPHLSLHLVRRAAQDFPHDQRDILEKWEAELEEFRDRPLEMLRVAVRMARDRKLVVRELQEATLETTGTGNPVSPSASFRLPLANAVVTIRQAILPILLVLRRIIFGSSDGKLQLIPLVGGVSVCSTMLAIALTIIGAVRGPSETVRLVDGTLAVIPIVIFFITLMYYRKLAQRVARELKAPAETGAPAVRQTATSSREIQQDR